KPGGLSPHRHADACRGDVAREIRPAMTGLTALNPFFLSLLPLAALPVAFHFFFRLKRQARPFPTLMFFHRLDPKLNARRRLREWLILLLRCLLILFLLLALARPVWFGR